MACFLPTRANKVREAKGWDSWGDLEGYTVLWTAGYWLTRRLHQLKASIAMDLGTTTFLFSASSRDVDKLGLDD